MAAMPQIHDRGVLGWFRAFELTGDLPDRVRVRDVIQTSLGAYRIVRCAGEIRLPPRHGGVVVLGRLVRAR